MLLLVSNIAFSLYSSGFCGNGEIYIRAKRVWDFPPWKWTEQGLFEEYPLETDSHACHSVALRMEIHLRKLLLQWIADNYNKLLCFVYCRKWVNQLLCVCVRKGSCLLVLTLTSFLYSQVVCGSLTNTWGMLWWCQSLCMCMCVCVCGWSCYGYAPLVKSLWCHSDNSSYNVPLGFIKAVCSTSGLHADKRKGGKCCRG